MFFFLLVPVILYQYYKLRRVSIIILYYNTIYRNGRGDGEYICNIIIMDNTTSNGAYLVAGTLKVRKKDARRPCMYSVHNIL